MVKCLFVDPLRFVNEINNDRKKNASTLLNNHFEKKNPWSLNKNNLFCFHGGLYKLINIISGITSSIKKISRIGNRNIWKYKIILRVTCILIKYIDFIDLIKIRSWLPSDIPLIVAVHRICWSGSKIWLLSDWHAYNV